MANSKATIVLDTSAVLVALELIEQLYQQARAYHVDILIPVTTLVELDRIKDREKFSSKGNEARKAINWINKILTTEDVDSPVLRGQRHSETLTPGLKADNSILDCCLYNVLHKRNMTILMSDDHNLRNRALAERLETLETQGMSAGQILEAIRERTAGYMDLDSSFEYGVIPQASEIPPYAGVHEEPLPGMVQKTQVESTLVDPATHAPAEPSYVAQDADDDMEVEFVAINTKDKSAAIDSVALCHSNHGLENSRWNALNHSARHTNHKQSSRRNSTSEFDKSSTKSVTPKPATTKPVHVGDEPQKKNMKSNHAPEKTHNETKRSILAPAIVHRENEPIRSIHAPKNSEKELPKAPIIPEATRKVIKESFNAPNTIHMEAVNPDDTRNNSYKKVEAKKMDPNLHKTPKKTRNPIRDPNETTQRTMKPVETFSEIHKEMIRPVRLRDNGSTLVANVASLADWHLHQEHPPEDLEMLGYTGKPEKYRAVFKLIKAYYVPIFRYILSRGTFARAEASLSHGTQSSDFRKAWGKMLIELAQHDHDYVDLVESMKP